MDTPQVNLISLPADDSCFRRVESNGQSVCPQSQHPIHRSWLSAIFCQRHESMNHVLDQFNMGWRFLLGFFFSTPLLTKMLYFLLSLLGCVIHYQHTCHGDKRGQDGGEVQCTFPPTTLGLNPQDGQSTDQCTLILTIL